MQTSRKSRLNSRPAHLGDRGEAGISYHGFQLAGIAMAIAGLAVGSGQTFLGGSFATYAPNALVAAAGAIVAIVGAVVDPMIEHRFLAKAEKRD
jgi:hypothetical protein